MPHIKPTPWIRYADVEFLTHLNNQDENIKFTMEIDNDKMLPFLNVGHTVYRKPTNTNIYLHAILHHYSAQIHSEKRH